MTTAMEARVDELLFTHVAGGWRIVIRRTADLFQTREFRESTWIQGICQTVPFMYVMEGTGTDVGPVPDFPGGHFGTYLRCTPRRPYSNRTIEDLYWLHELVHLVTWRSGGSQEPPVLTGKHETWYDWGLRMIDSELVAAVHSECMPHIVIDGVRELSFKHPIWVDRYLNEGGLMERFRSGDLTIEQLYGSLAAERRRVLEGNRRFNDYVERQVGGYYETNLDWTELFGRETVGFGPHADEPAFRCVEAHLPDLDDPDKHVRWLEETTPTTADLNRLGLTPAFQVPLGCQAHSFGIVFGAYLHRFGNAIFFK